MAEHYCVIEIEHQEHDGRGLFGIFKVLAESKYIELTHIRSAAGEIPSIVLTGGWLYAVGDSPKVGTGSATASAPGSKLIIILNGGVEKFVHPDKPADGRAAVTLNAGTPTRSFSPTEPSFIVVSNGQLNGPFPLTADPTIEQFINEKITPEARRRQLD